MIKCNTFFHPFLTLSCFFAVRHFWSVLGQLSSPTCPWLLFINSGASAAAWFSFFFSHVTSSRHDSHKPRTQFAHKRTVRLIVDKDVEDIDALRLAQSLQECSGETKGVIFLFRRRRNLPRRALILRTFTCRNCLAFSDNEAFGFVAVEFPNEDRFTCSPRTANWNTKCSSLFLP